MKIPETRAAFAARLWGVLLAGALLAAAGSVAAGFALGLAGFKGAASAIREFLAGGGWVWLPLWGAAAGALRALPWAPSGRWRWLTVGFAIVLAGIPLALRPVSMGRDEGGSPRSAEAKARAILRWSYRSPSTVARILALSRDPEPRVREHAALALGVNLIVTDIERATLLRPSRHAHHPLRDSLRLRLLELLQDPAKPVRVEAARALWKAPLAFGAHPEAAETLTAVLDRAREDASADRLIWLALDAAAGAPDSGLKAGAARFAAAASDTHLARVAWRAASWE